MHAVGLKFDVPHFVPSASLDLGSESTRMIFTLRHTEDQSFILGRGIIQ